MAMTPHFSMKCFRAHNMKLCGCSDPAFILKNKHKLKAPDQRQLPMPKWFPRARTVTCLAGWQSLLQCKWRGTSHRRCHWRRGHQNQTKPCTTPPICTPNPSMLLLQLCGSSGHCRFVTHLVLLKSALPQTFTPQRFPPTSSHYHQDG